MPEIKFACPHCQQHISAESSYAGMQISCPTCSGSILVPGTPVAAPVGILHQEYATAPATVMVAPPPAPSYTPSPAAPSGGLACPSCGGALPRGAVLCTLCGFNLQTRRKATAPRPGTARRPAGPPVETPWYKTAYPYLGVVAALLALFYFLGKQNEAMKLAFLGTALLTYFGASLVVLIAAFKESVGTGFLCLCVPFYALYWVFKVNENETIKLIYTFATVLMLALRFLD